MNTPTPETAPAPSLPPLETVSGADLVSTLPAVNERAIAATNGTPAPDATPAAPASTPAAPSGPAVVDAAGRTFDPVKFRLKDGKPFTNGRGLFMPRGGRKKGLAGEQAKLRLDAKPDATGSKIPDKFPTAAPAPASGAPGAPGTTPAPNPAQALELVEAHELAAETYLRSGYHLAGCVLTAREEWQPDDKAEHNGLKSVVVATQRAYGINPPPPWVALILSVLNFVITRMSRPKTAARLVQIWPSLAPVLGVEPPQKPEAKPAAKAQPTPAPAKAPAPGGLSSSPHQANAEHFFG